MKLPSSVGRRCIPITVTSTSAHGSCSDNGELAVLDTRDNERNVPAAELVSGPPKVWDGAIRPESVPNVLVFGCGFTAADQAEFEKIVDGMVHLIRTDRMLQPYGHLATSMKLRRLMLRRRCRRLNPVRGRRALVDGSCSRGGPAPASPAAGAGRLADLSICVRRGPRRCLPTSRLGQRRGDHAAAFASRCPRRAHDPATLDSRSSTSGRVARPVPGVNFPT